MGAKSDTAKRPRDPCSQTTGLHKESEKLGGRGRGGGAQPSPWAGECGVGSRVSHPG